jgi:hypothetical protein
LYLGLKITSPILLEKNRENLIRMEQSGPPETLILATYCSLKLGKAKEMRGERDTT